VSKKVLLRMEKIVKAFPGVKALDGVDLEVYKGEVLALVGENGAGKTTLMEILNPHPAPTGFYIQDSGKIYFEEKEIKPRTPLEAQKIGISFIHQHFNLAPNLSVAENVLLGREPRKGGIFGVVDRKEMDRIVASNLSRLGVKFSASTPISELGAAQKQMVEIAKALSIDAKLIIMDEPTASLTDNEVDKLFSIVNKLKKEGMTFIFVTHKLNEVFQISDRIVVLRDGKMIGSLNTKKTNENKVTKMMVGRDLQMFPERKTKIGKKVLEVSNISRKGLIDNISFEVREGEILGIYGLVGAGRTETMRAIFGVDKLDEGEIYIGEEKVLIKSPADAINKGFGFVPEDRQQQGLIPLMNIKENITLPILDRISKNKIIREKEERKIVSKYINELKISPDDPVHLVKGLSGGNQQKVVLAKWLASVPKILILDEPTRGIDVGAKAEIHFRISLLALHGLGIIIVSSELPEIIKMSDRILVMAEGRITGEFSRKEATEEKIIGCAVMQN
jgi:ribose transport system ATP-binding protein